MRFKGVNWNVTTNDALNSRVYVQTLFQTHYPTALHEYAYAYLLLYIKWNHTSTRKRVSNESTNFSFQFLLNESNFLLHISWYMLVNDHARIQDGRNHIHDIKSHVLECVWTMLLIAHDLKPTTHAFFRATNQVVHLYWPEPQTSTLSEEIREERRKQGCCVII